MKSSGTQRGPRGQVVTELSPGVRALNNMEEKRKNLVLTSIEVNKKKHLNRMLNQQKIVQKFKKDLDFKSQYLCDSALEDVHRSHSARGSRLRSPVLTSRPASVMNIDIPPILEITPQQQTAAILNSSSGESDNDCGQTDNVSVDSAKQSDSGKDASGSVEIYNHQDLTITDFDHFQSSSSCSKSAAPTDPMPTPRQQRNPDSVHNNIVNGTFSWKHGRSGRRQSAPASVHSAYLAQIAKSATQNRSKRAASIGHRNQEAIIGRVPEKEEHPVFCVSPTSLSTISAKIYRKATERDVLSIVAAENKPETGNGLLLATVTKEKCSYLKSGSVPARRMSTANCKTPDSSVGLLPPVASLRRSSLHEPVLPRLSLENRRHSAQSIHAMKHAFMKMHIEPTNARQERLRATKLHHSRQTADLHAKTINKFEQVFQKSIFGGV